MKKIAIALAVACAVLAGCAASAEEGTQSASRFELVIAEGKNTVYVDNETGVMYLFHKYGDSGGLVVMVDAEGNPLIWEG